MTPNKEWMTLNDRTTPQYLQGVDDFLDFAFGVEDTNGASRVRCPCNDCLNVLIKTRDEIHYHLLKNGIFRNYTTWDKHGEFFNDPSSENNETNNDVDYGDMLHLLQDGCGVPGINLMEDGEEASKDQELMPEVAKFYRLLKEYQEPLVFENERVSKLEYVVKLLHLKCLHHWTDNSFTDLLKFQNEILGASLPTSYYECRKVISDLGLDYIKIDACPNDCIIYWEENANATECPICLSSRWKKQNNCYKGKNIPHKVLRYFPITPRLKRLYMSSKTAKEMCWHKDGKANDDVMRHPADSPAWKSFDDEYKSFADDPRSVRLGLAADGFQPFNNIGGTSHSIWPVVLVPYNLPPWMCMKPPYIMLSLLIPGPNSPGMDLDVYLQPLIKELKELWEVGSETYDAQARQNFIMRVVVLWTISDFPAYADLSGWMTKGEFACPSCHKDTGSRSIKDRVVYMRHRRWLPMNHRWRKMDNAFDKTIEKGLAPIPLSGDEVLDQYSQFTQVPFGKSGKKRKWDETNSKYGWRKKSIFFKLPYWSKLRLRHNLDVMHIEKNVSENIIGTLMNIKGKTKDTLKARLDLVNMEIRKDLHPIVMGDKIRVPMACYTLTSEEKLALCEMLQNLKAPDGYCSNISRCVKDNGRNLSGMKSHDHHIFLEQLLPLAIRGLLSKHVCEPLIELSYFFRNLCSKNLTIKNLDALEQQIPYTMSKLEIVFPPSFFSSMVHLVIHLVAEAKIAGPVMYRWMYPIERYLRTLKSYVRNKAYPEGSIAMGYLADECLTFCSRYMGDMNTKFNRRPRNDEGDNVTRETSNLEIFQALGRPLGKPTSCHISLEEFKQVHLYILLNCEELNHLVEKHKEELKSQNPRNVMGRHKAEYSNWVYNCVDQMYKEGSVNEDLYNLVCGPSRTVQRYGGYIVNGYRFHTTDRQENKKSQNNGVMVRGDDESDKEYYGILNDVFELHYPGGNRVFAFKCDWYDVKHKDRGYKIDDYGITSVHKERFWFIDESFVLESQVEQVFYVQDPKNADWLGVIKTQPRDLYKMPDNNIDVQYEALQLDDVDDVDPHVKASNDFDNINNWARNHFLIEKGAAVVKWYEKELKKITENKGLKRKKKKLVRKRKQSKDLEDFIVDD